MKIDTKFPGGGGFQQDLKASPQGEKREQNRDKTEFSVLLLKLHDPPLKTNLLI